MAIDNTPPRLRLIATIAVIVVITLVSLDFVLKSYFAFMTDEAYREKLAPLTARDEQRKAEETSFAGAKMPIDKAMASLKDTRGEIVEPKQSEDMAPMTGWAKMPKQAPLPAPTAAVTPPPEAPTLGDAGISRDAGARRDGRGGDAGARMPQY